MTDHTQTIHSKDKGSFANASLDLSTHDNSEVVPRRSSRSRGHSANNSKNFNEETIINDLPLQHLAVYVEVMSNDTNISDTTYKYLEVLGAKIEKRLNLKCNLVIWKDGTLKTVHKAKALGIPIVNSLWLEDCLEKSHCADFEKFTPKLLTNEEWPFVAIPRPKKRKRRSIGLHQADESGSDSKESKKLTSHQTKKLKSKSKSKDQQKEVRVRILWSPTKASRLGNSKSGSKSKEPTRSRRSRPRVSKKSKSPSIRVGALHWRIVRTRTPDLEGLDGVDLEKMDAEKPEPSVSSIENKSPLGPEIQERIRKQHEEQEAIEVRNMIIRYATLSSVQIDRPLSSDKDTDFDELDGFYRRRNFLEESEENKSDFDLSLGSPEEEEKAMPVAPVKPVRVLRSASKSANKSANKDSLLRNPAVPAKGKFEDLQPQSKAKTTTRSAAAKTTALKATPISKKDALVTPQTKAGSTAKKTPATPATPECPDCPNNTQVSVLSFMEEEEQEEETPKEELFNSLDLKTRSGSRERGRNKEVSTPVTIIKTRRQSAEEKKSTQRKEPLSAKSSVVAATPKKGSKKKADITPNRTLDTFGFVVKSGTKDKDKDKTPKKMEVEQEDIRGTKILFNSFRRSELMILRGFCEKFELKYLNDAIRSVLDSEMLVFEGNEAPKNYKTALAMALGKPIVKEDWVSESLKADKLLDYREFEIKYDRDVRKELLAKMKFQVDKEISEMPVNMVTQKDIVTLIEGASGTICYNIKSCDYVVMRKTTKKKTGAPAHVKSVTPQWIIDSVIEGKLLNTDSPAYSSG